MEWIVQFEQINEVATRFCKWIGDKTVVAFHGGMGSGKTTFIHALCSVKEVKDIVGSPTFSIINEYAYVENGAEKKIYHIDLYRLKGEEEARQAGVEDCLYSGQLCLVEWPEKAPLLFPENTVHIYMDVVDEQTRKLQIRKN